MEQGQSQQVNRGYLRDLGEQECWAHLQETLAFEVDDFEPDMRRGWSVLVVGEARSIDDADELAEMRPQQRLEPWAPGSRNLFIRITPRQVTGRDLH